MSAELSKNHLTPSGRGAYEREKCLVGPPDQPGHYGYVGWIDPNNSVKEQMDTILREVGSYIQVKESRPFHSENLRRVQIKAMVGNSELDAFVAEIGAENVEGIVSMTGGEYAYVLCGQTAATEEQWSEHRKTAQATHRTMVGVATKDGLARSIPPLNNQSGYKPSHGHDSDTPEPEAVHVMEKIRQLTAVQAKTGIKPGPDVQRFAGNPFSATESSVSPERNNEFNISYLLPDLREKYGIAPVYIDQHSLSGADNHTRTKWVESIVRIWGPKFGWDEQKVNDLFDEIASGKNKSWICAVEQKGILVAAAIADVATIADQNGETKGVVIESNEWGVDEDTSTRLNDGVRLPGIGSLAVTLVHATAALRCLDESGNIVGLEIDGKRYPTAVYAEVNAASDVPACKAALRAQMSATETSNGQIGCMYGHVKVNGKPHGVFMIMQVPPDDMKGLVNGTGQRDMERVIGYDKLRNTLNGNIYTCQQGLRPNQKRMEVVHRRKRRAQKNH